MTHRITILALLMLLWSSLAGASPTDSLTVEEVTFSSGDVELAGRLWLPAGDGPHPAIVFIPGSGKSIRDLQLDPDPVPFHFASRGVAFFAWDKRGVRDSGGQFRPLPDDDATAQRDHLRLLASDAVAAMDHLGQRTDIDADRIGAWAFSQGGWVAAELGMVGGSPRFVVVVGGPAVSIGEELAYSALADTARDRSRAYEGRLDLDALYEALADDRPASGFGGYDPMPALETVEFPMLYLLGERDLSVPTRRSVERLEPLGRRHEWIDYRVFPGANHGVATRDAAGTWYMAEEFYATQFDYLINLGMLSPVLKVEARREARMQVKLEETTR